MGSAVTMMATTVPLMLHQMIVYPMLKAHIADSTIVLCIGC